MSDVDGNTDVRRGTVSAYNGPEPTVAVLGTVEEEAVTIAEWIEARLREGVPPEEIGVFVRSQAKLDRAVAAIEAAGLPVTSRKVVSQCTILINCQLAACRSTSSPDATSRPGEGSNVTIVM